MEQHGPRLRRVAAYGARSIARSLIIYILTAEGQGMMLKRESRSGYRGGREVGFLVDTYNPGSLRAGRASVLHGGAGRRCWRQESHGRRGQAQESEQHAHSLLSSPLTEPYMPQTDSSREPVAISFGRVRSGKTPCRRQDRGRAQRTADGNMSYVFGTLPERLSILM